MNRQRHYYLTSSGVHIAPLLHPKRHASEQPLRYSKNVVKLADFGVSQIFHDEDALLSTTAGTPAFFSPESVDRKVSTFEGRPVDVWAMGVTLFCMLFAETPFDGANPTLLIAAINHTEADIRGQAEQLDVPLSEPVRMAHAARLIVLVIAGEGCF